MTFAVLNIHGKKIGEATTIGDAMDLGDRCTEQGDSFLIKEGNRKAEEVNWLLRKEWPRLKCIRDLQIDIDRLCPTTINLRRN